MLREVRFLIVVSATLGAAFAQAAPAKTIENLKAAFAGETTAFSKYTQYAKVAQKDGKPYEAGLFAAAARAEGYHARNHRRVLESFGVTVAPSRYKGKVGDTLANLQDAFKGETYESKTMYPEFIRVARQEGADDAVRSFTYALSAEKTHAQLYSTAAKDEKSGKTLDAKTFYVCPNCGETFAANAPRNCPVCATDKSLFVRVR